MLATDVPKVAVEDLDVAVDDLERRELIVTRGDAGDKEEGGVAPVDDLVAWWGAVRKGRSARQQSADGPPD
jgi:hypothetical protein